MKVQCDYCGKETNKKSTFVKRNKHNFCNRGCFNRYIQKAMVKCTCCGAPLRRSPSQIHTTNFCNRSCYAKYRSKKTALVCDYCGKEFERKYSAVTGRLYHFCSQECYSQYRREKQPVVKCDFCGKLITRTISSLNKFNRHFCGLDCRNKFMQKREQTYCYYCGAKIERPPSLLKDKEHIFCNADCYHAWHRGANHVHWQGGNYASYYGSNWEPQRHRARERDNYCCRICGISESKLGQDLCVHHLIPFARFGLEQYQLANCLANLCCLCPGDHGKLERLPLRQQVAKLHF